MSNQALLKHFRTVKVIYFLLHTFMASYVQLKVPAPDGAGLHRRVAEHKDRKRKSAVSPTKTKAVRSVSKKKVKKVQIWIIYSFSHRDVDIS